MALRRNAQIAADRLADTMTKHAESTRVNGLRIVDPSLIERVKPE